MPPRLTKRNPSSSSVIRGEPPESLTKFLGFCMKKLAQYIDERFESAFADGEAKARHFGVLHVLAEAGPSAQQAICGALWIDRGTMVGLIDDLERLGFAERAANPADRRSFLVSITPRGRDFHRKGLARVQVLEREIFPSLESIDLDQLRALLRSLMRDARCAQAPRPAPRPEDGAPN